MGCELNEISPGTTPNNQRCQSRKAGAATATTTAATSHMVIHDNSTFESYMTALSNSRQTLATFRKESEQKQSGVDFTFLARDSATGEAFVGRFPKSPNYAVSMDSESDQTGKHLVHIIVPPMYLIEEIMDEWVNVLFAIGQRNGCDYQGWRPISSVQ